MHTHSAFGSPPRTQIVALPGHCAVRTLVDNAALQLRLDDVDRGVHEFFTIDTGSTEVPAVSSVLDGYAIFPPGFEKDRAAGRSAPLLVYVYGEPAACTVRDISLDCARFVVGGGGGGGVVVVAQLCFCCSLFSVVMLSVVFQLLCVDLSFRQKVRDAWGGNVYMWHLLMAQRGYVVVSFDSRGTPAPKGRAWRKSVYRKIGVTSNNDQVSV